MKTTKIFIAAFFAFGLSSTAFAQTTPGTTAPSGSMSTPGTTTTPRGTMSTPNGSMSNPNGSMGNSSGTMRDGNSNNDGMRTDGAMNGRTGTHGTKMKGKSTKGSGHMKTKTTM